MTMRKMLLPMLGLFLLIVMGCATGDILGYPPPPPPDDDTAAGAELRGEVVDVDTRTREIELDTTASAAPYAGTLRRRDDRAAFFYTDGTRVTYQGRAYNPQDLEPGDLVAVHLAEGARRVAETIVVERSVQERRGKTEPDAVQGAVERVDTRSRELHVRSNGDLERIAYQDRTPVYYEGKEYRVEQLEPGDVVKVAVDRSTYDGGLEARRVDVVRSVQDRDDSDPYPGRTGARSYTGTVSWVDERSGEFGLEVRGDQAIRVSLPFNAGAEIRETFQRLRQGSRVRIEAMPLDDREFELVRFR